MAKIIDHLSQGEILAQMAEELAEAAQAAQKPLTPERCWTQARSTTTTTRTATGNVAARSTWERTEERTDETKNQI